MPPPHSTVQDDHDVYKLQPPLTGQALSLQPSDFASSPTQSAPPLAGEGLLHVLYLVLLPPPHSAEHTDQSPYELQPPAITSGASVVGETETEAGRRVNRSGRQIGSSDSCPPT